MTLGREVSGAPPVLSHLGSRVEYRHGDEVVEWFDNLPQGIEHGYTLARRPVEATGTSVELRVRVDGLTARTAEPGVIHLDRPDGEAVLGYTKLKVWDATGADLTAEMHASPDGREIILTFNDAAARYPVTVDPLIVNFEVALDSGVDAPSEFGYSVAMDGDTAVVGCPDDDEPIGINAGSVYIFFREPNSAEWAMQGRIIRFSGVPTDGNRLGESVAVHGDLLVAGSRLADKRNGFGEILEADSGKPWWPAGQTLTGPSRRYFLPPMAMAPSAEILLPTRTNSVFRSGCTTM